MSNTYKQVVIGDSNGNNNVGSDPYVQSFIVNDWTLQSGSYIIDIFEAVHEKGEHVQCEVYQDIGGSFEEVILDIEVNNSGDVKIKVSSSPDLRFNGYIHIL